MTQVEAPHPQQTMTVSYLRMCRPDRVAFGPGYDCCSITCLSSWSDVLIAKVCVAYTGDEIGDIFVFVEAEGCE